MWKALAGFVAFPIKYDCVVFRPFKWGILEAAVTMLIPEDMEIQAGDIPNYSTSDGSVTSVKIQKDSEVRVKIIGNRVDLLLLRKWRQMTRGESEHQVPHNAHMLHFQPSGSLISRS